MSVPIKGFYNCKFIILGAQKAASPSTLIPNQAFCGANLVAIGSGLIAATICSKLVLFNIWGHKIKTYIAVVYKEVNGGKIHSI